MEEASELEYLRFFYKQVLQDTPFTVMWGYEEAFILSKEKNPPAKYKTKIGEENVQDSHN